MKSRALAFASLLSAAVAGCGTSIEFTQTHTSSRLLAARAPASVEILTAGPPQRPFVEVGMIEARQESAYSTDDRRVVLLKLRDYAAHMGCDAVVVTGDTSVSTFFTGDRANPWAGVTERAGYRGTCILYTAPPAAQN